MDDGALVKIVLVGLSPMLQEVLVETLGNQPDMVVVDELDTSRCPDFLILGANDGELREEVLLACPATRVIVLTQEGAQAFLHELRPHATPLGKLTPTEILGTIRKLSRTDSSSAGQ